MINSIKANKQTTLICMLLIIILGATIYSSSLSGKFVWDDKSLIENNEYIKNWSMIPKLFTEEIGIMTEKQYAMYRPLQMITYMVDYSVWKLEEKGYHLTNIFLHILTALSIFWFINILFKDVLLSLFSAILFIVHPVHTEAVSYISGRADPLAGVFILLCLITYIKQQSSKSIFLYVLVLLSYVCALLSRESSLIVPLLIILYHYAFKKQLKMKYFLPILGITFVYLILRVTILKVFLSYPTPTTTTLLQRMPGFFAAITNYIKLLLLPTQLHMEYGSKQLKFTNPLAISGLVILLSSLFYALKKRRNNVLIFFSVSWFFIALLPVSGIYPINAYMAEHWLYLPSIGFFLIIAKGLSTLYRKKSFQIVTIIFIAGLLSTYSYLSVRQNKYWKDPISFYERTITYAPRSRRLYNNLGNAYSSIGKKEKSIELFKKAIEIDPNYAGAYNNLATGHFDIGKIQEAIILFNQALEVDPDFAGAHYNLAVCYYSEKRYDLSIKHCDKAIELDFRVDPNFLKLLEPFRKKELTG